ncbi:uncharacterized protein ACA1_139570 [Acanthamoeba castellanii str. Neff]|uniref:Uncharacterized protein n=1 Tax=Acanthamoeba castellanii (strain ATCC 30010 / Neff) TaxID=1257118 RepID=L8GME1_ACACF|nr:uncharacterized protein ACA1_139570 [Acanthamoeba castellanii str. Neff]ELR14230.1 hypothetical protein ACA1_139570 [Acanthamoeba castellanii str. Neff]
MNVLQLKKKMVDELKVEVNSFLCTRYLNGLQYIGKHADDQANVKDGRVVTVSLGAYVTALPNFTAAVVAAAAGAAGVAVMATTPTSL